MTFFFTMCFMFLVFWRPQDWLFRWLFGFPLLDIFTALSVLALVLEIDGRTIRIKKDLPQIWLFIGLWVATIVSHIPNTYFGGIVKTLPETAKFSMFGILLMLATDRLSRLRAIAVLFVVMGLFMAVHGLLQVERGYGFGYLQPILTARPLQEMAVIRSRFYGIFNDPNDLAQFLAVCLPFTLLLFKRLRIWALLIAAGLCFVIVRGLLTTDSRGGFIALAVATTLSIGAFLRPRWQRWVWWGVVVGWLAVLPFAGSFMDQSGWSRVVFWGDANQAFKAHPFFGVGYGEVSQYITGAKAVHNAFVACYAEIGLFGYWFWFALLLAGFIAVDRVGRLVEGSRNERALYIGRFAGLTRASLGAYIASGYFLSRAFAWPLFFLVGVAAALPQVAERELGEAVIIPAFEPRRFAVMNSLFSWGSIVYIYGSILLLNRAWGG